MVRFAVLSRSHAYVTHSNMPHYTRFARTHGSRLVKLFKPNIKECIMDGEMLHWDRENKVVVTKGASDIDIKNSEKFTEGGKFTQKLVVFDLVSVNGESVINHEFVERWKGLCEVFTPDEETLALCPHWECNSLKEMEDIVNAHYEQREEGVIIKSGSGRYSPGARRAVGWFKWKPEYNDALIEPVDLVIVGG